MPFALTLFNISFNKVSANISLTWFLVINILQTHYVMKKKISSPILELSFAAGIMVILALPLLVNAQDHKEFKVNINNADTIINGKNIKELSASDRKDALKKLDELNDHISITMTQDNGDSGTMLKSVNGKTNLYVYKEGVLERSPVTKSYSLSIDSTGDRNIAITANGSARSSIAPHIAYSLRADSYSDRSAPDGRGIIYSYNSSNRKNTQNFSYSNTDNDGISTHINFSVGDAGAEKAKKISGSEKTDLTIQDLNIVPSFSTGKTTLSFTLASKAAADVQFKDNEGIVLWEGKTTGSEFSKSFTLPKNGVYYLQVKQGGKLALRRINKEE